MHCSKLHGVWKTALFHEVLVEGDETCRDHDVAAANERHFANLHHDLSHS